VQSHKYIDLLVRVRKIDESAKLQLPSISGRKRINHRHEFIISLMFPTRSAAVSFRPDRAYRRTSKKQQEYKDDNLRLSPFAQRIDFTGFRAHPITRPLPSSLSLFSSVFFSTSFSSSSSRTHIRTRQKEIPPTSRAALRVYRKKRRFGPR